MPMAASNDDSVRRTPQPPAMSATGTPAAGGAGSSRRGTIVSGVLIALAIVAAAWVFGGRAGFQSIGEGGINQRLLPKVGDVAPDFETSDVLGNRVRLSDFRGHPVWLMFWGSWCPPCRAEFPDVVAAYKKLAPEGVRLLAVSLREPAVTAASYAADNHATFLVLSDPDETDTGAAYPIMNFPTHIFIDKDGVIRAISLEDLSEEQAIAAAQSILPAGTATPAS
jgi:peroxiredoxin